MTAEAGGELEPKWSKKGCFFLNLETPERPSGQDRDSDTQKPIKDRTFITNLWVLVNIT